MAKNFAAFYDVDKEYIDYLKKIEPHIMNVEYSHRNKFVYGVVLETDDKIKYFVPVSHYAKNKENNIQIKIDDNGKMIVSGSLRFNYMFPIPDKCLKAINFKNKEHFATNEERIKVEKEYRYIKKKIGTKNIRKIAEKTYNDVINKTNPELVENSCDFKLLEKAYLEYLELIKENTQNPPTPPTLLTPSNNNGLEIGNSSTGISDDSGITDNIANKMQSIIKEFKESLIDMPRQLSEAHESCMTTHKQILNLEKYFVH